MTSLALSRRQLLTAGLAAPFVLRSSVALSAPETLKFALAAPFDGSNAAFFLAEKQGWYKEAGLSCQFDASGGSGAAASQVGSGVYDLGVADINVMAEFNAKNPGADVRNVYMLYYRSPLSVGSLKKSGIQSPADLNGRTIGAAAPDGAYRLFPAFAQAAGVDAARLKWNMVGLQLREAVLARGDVEAILGFDSTMFFGLKKAGIPADDVRFIYYADVGLDLYGNGILVGKKLRTEKPDVVKRFVAVTARAWQAAIADPGAAIAALKEHAPLIDAALEEEKLRWLIKNQLMTAESRQDGLGSVRPERLAATMATVAKTLGFPVTPTPQDVFDAAFLPAMNLRMLPA